MSTQILQLLQTDSTFLEKAAHKVFVNNEAWFHLPFWYKKIGDGLYTEHRFEDLPEYLKAFLNTVREINQKPPFDNSQEQRDYLEGKY